MKRRNRLLLRDVKMIDWKIIKINISEKRQIVASK